MLSFSSALKKKISVIIFQRILKSNMFFICCSSLFSVKEKYITNYMLKSLYYYLFPNNFLKSSFKSNKLQNFTNNFLVYSYFSYHKDLISYVNYFKDKLQISFIKYKNLYFINNFKYFLEYFNIHLLFLKLNALLLNLVNSFCTLLKVK